MKEKWNTEFKNGYSEKLRYIARIEVHEKYRGSNNLKKHHQMPVRWQKRVEQKSCCCYHTLWTVKCAFGFRMS